jgi:hypothetical protein
LVCVEPLAPVELIIYSKLVSPIICVGQFNHQNHFRKRCKPISLSTAQQDDDVAQQDASGSGASGLRNVYL